MASIHKRTRSAYKVTTCTSHVAIKIGSTYVPVRVRTQQMAGIRKWASAASVQTIKSTCMLTVGYVRCIVEQRQCKASTPQIRYQYMFVVLQLNTKKLHSLMLFFSVGHVHYVNIDKVYTRLALFPHWRHSVANPPDTYRPRSGHVRVHH